MTLYSAHALIVSALCAAYSNVLVKSGGGDIDSIVLISGQMICGILPLILYSLIHEGNPLAMHWTPNALFSIFYLALVGTVAAFMLFYWLVRQINVTTTQLISLVTPVAAVVIGVVFLGEEVSSRIVIGGLCILSGIAVILWSRKVKAQLG